MALFSDSAWRDMTTAMWYARGMAEQLHREMFNHELVVTSGRRPQTPGGSSKHIDGDAMDVRTRDKTREEEFAFATALALRLGEDFDVIIEGKFAIHSRYRSRVRHVHVEYDPKGRHAPVMVE